LFTGTWDADETLEGSGVGQVDGFTWLEVGADVLSPSCRVSDELVEVLSALPFFGELIVDDRVSLEGLVFFVFFHGFSKLFDIVLELLDILSGTCTSSCISQCPLQTKTHHVQSISISFTVSRGT